MEQQVREPRRTESKQCGGDEFQYLQRPYAQPQNNREVSGYVGNETKGIGYIYAVTVSDQVNKGMLGVEVVARINSGWRMNETKRSGMEDDDGRMDGWLPCWR